jgi:2-polyprenyl-3-methyl-5-hydroxy-6-metoxy-1,4-benzoquinol methylase
MPSFHSRSNQKELLDQVDIPFNDIKRNMEELEFINKRLGGHEITLDGIAGILKEKFSFNEPIRITELGCGGGDNLKAIAKWARKNRVPVELTGIDINNECISYAQSQSKTIQYICSDFRNVQFTTKPHILFSSLFCHHFTDVEIVSMLTWMKNNSSLGFFINDLHRNLIAFYLIKILTGIFSKSYLVKNDAPISVSRGFIKKDWRRYFEEAEILQYSCTWRWAFRWLIICHNGIQNQHI